MTRTIIGTLIIIFGLAILLGDLVVKIAMALVLVYLGIRILSGPHGRRLEAGNAAPQTSSSDYLNEVVIFGPLDKTIKSDNFKGGKIVVVFSGGDVDISQVRTSESLIDLEFVAVFGGARLIVPKGWKVNSHGTAVLGAYNNHVQGIESQTTLNVRGSAVLASIEIVS